MRSLKIVVGVVAMTVTMPAFASGEEPIPKPPKRVTASAFAEAGFPVVIIDAVNQANVVARNTANDRIRARRHFTLIEESYDYALGIVKPNSDPKQYNRILFPGVSPILIEARQENYRFAIKKLQEVEFPLRAADQEVIRLYNTWVVEGSDPKVTRVFEEWETAAEASYSEASRKESEKVYGLMFRLGDFLIDQLGKQWTRLDSPENYPRFWAIGR